MTERLNLSRSWGLLLFSLFLLSSGATSAGLEQGGGFGLEGEGKDPLQTRVVLDRAKVPPGGKARVAVVLDIAEGWHAYGNPMGPGIGAPTRVTGVDREGFEFSGARYLPGKKKESELAGEDWVFAFTGEVPVFLEVKVADDVAPGTYSLKVTLETLLCKESCIPYTRDLAFDLKVAEVEGKVPALHSEIFARFEPAKPAPEDGGEAAETEAVEKGDSAEASATIDISRYQPRSPEGDGVSGIFLAIIFGFIAGVLLNVMPCVLPVLSIKITSLLSQAHEERGKVLKLGLSFGAGIMVVFLVLAALAATLGMSWGGLFQSAVFNVVMIGLVFVFALGMFDVYIIAVSGNPASGGSQEGYAGSFYKGVLATFLATPCSGPFLGATLAWALSQHWLIIFAVFTSIGLGMASPYVVLSAWSGLLRFVPRPGRWMETFKHLMGFLLMGTVVYLFTFLRQELFTYTLALCLALALAAYLWGRYAHAAVPAGKKWTRRCILAAFSAGFVVFVATRPLESEESRLLSNLEKFHNQNKTVVLEFTADWCPNCRYVEATVLESEAVKEAMEEKDAEFLVADITHTSQDSPEVRLLNQLGSHSIPFLAVFPGDDHFHPYVLRDIYTKEDLLAILEKCP